MTNDCVQGSQISGSRCRVESRAGAIPVCAYTAQPQKRRPRRSRIQTEFLEFCLEVVCLCLVLNIQILPASSIRK